MQQNDELGHAKDRLKHTLKQAIDQAGEQASAPAKQQINVAGRANVVVSSNVGAEGSTRETSATQTTRIRQDGNQSVETTETSTSTSEQD